MNYAELAVMQASRAKTFSTAQTDAMAAYCQAEHDLKELQAENAKLRELLADLAICACGKYCYGCPHQYDGCNRDQRLRELGIEVDR